MFEKDFVRYIKAMRKMRKTCKEQNKSCMNCAFNEGCKKLSPLLCFFNNPEEIVQIINEWCENHPEKTYKQDFLSMLPNAPINGAGFPKACRAHVYNGGCPAYGGRGCEECWNEIMPEEDI